MAEIGLFEAMYTARALRRFKPDPVPDEIMTKVLDAAIRAPSGSNAQTWLFVVVKDAEKRRQLGAMGVHQRLYGPGLLLQPRWPIVAVASTSIDKVGLERIEGERVLLNRKCPPPAGAE